MTCEKGKVDASCPRSAPCRENGLCYKTNGEIPDIVARGDMFDDPETCKKLKVDPSICRPDFKKDIKLYAFDGRNGDKGYVMETKFVEVDTLKMVDNSVHTDDSSASVDESMANAVRRSFHRSQSRGEAIPRTEVDLKRMFEHRLETCEENLASDDPRRDNGIKWLDGVDGVRSESYTEGWSIFTAPHVLWVEYARDARGPGFQRNGIHDTLEFQRIEDNDWCRYSLVSIGLQSPGHYRAAVRRADGWWLADDSKVRRIDDGLNDEDVRRTAKDFFFQQVGCARTKDEIEENVVHVVERPPIGIQNRGQNTCWFATILQMLASTPLFTREVEAAQLADNTNEKNREFGKKFKEMMRLLVHSDRDAARRESDDVMMQKKNALIDAIQACFDRNVAFAGEDIQSMGEKLLHVLSLLHDTYGTFGNLSNKDITRKVKADMNVRQNVHKLYGTIGGREEMKTPRYVPLTLSPGRNEGRMQYESRQLHVRDAIAEHVSRHHARDVFYGRSFVRDLFGFNQYKVTGRGKYRNGNHKNPTCFRDPLVEYDPNVNDREDKTNENSNVKTRLVFGTVFVVYTSR